METGIRGGTVTSEFEWGARETPKLCVPKMLLGALGCLRSPSTIDERLASVTVVKKTGICEMYLLN